MAPITSTTITRLWDSGGGVEAVDRVGRDLNGGLEADVKSVPAKVVVDHLQDATDNGYIGLGEL